MFSFCLLGLIRTSSITWSRWLANIQIQYLLLLADLQTMLSFFISWIWGLFEICYFSAVQQTLFMQILYLAQRTCYNQSIHKPRKKDTFNDQEKISHKKRIMDVVPCTVDQERKKNPDFVLSLIWIDDRPSAAWIDQNACGDCPKGKANLL